MDREYNYILSHSSRARKYVARLGELDAMGMVSHLPKMRKYFTKDNNDDTKYTIRDSEVIEISDDEVSDTTTSKNKEPPKAQLVDAGVQVGLPQLMEEDDDSPRVVTCVICTDKLPTMVFLPCKHLVACRTCTTDWLKKSPRCPLCQRKTKKQMDIKIP